MLTLKPLLRRLRLIAEDWHVPPFLEMDVEFNLRHGTIAVWISVRNPTMKTVDLSEVIPVDCGPLFLAYGQFQAAVTSLTDQLQAVIAADSGEDEPPRDECGPLFEIEAMGRDQ